MLCYCRDRRKKLEAVQLPSRRFQSSGGVGGEEGDGPVQRVLRERKLRGHPRGGELFCIISLEGLFIGLL